MNNDPECNHFQAQAGMKGNARCLATVIRYYEGKVHDHALLQYADGATAITENGRLIGLWEPEDGTRGCERFLQLVENYGPLTHICLKNINAATSHSSQTSQLN